jgi:hypothetical protein
MYAYVIVKHKRTTGNKQHINREKQWVFKYFLHIFNLDLSIIRLMNLSSKLLSVSLSAGYSEYFPENMSGFRLVYEASKMASHVLCECGALATL